MEIVKTLAVKAHNLCREEGRVKNRETDKNEWPNEERAVGQHK